jgi:hypothetical protein
MDQCGPLLNNPNARVAVAVDPPLVALGQAEPSFQIEVVSDLGELGSAHEEASQKAQHDRGEVLVDLIGLLSKATGQRLKLLLATRAASTLRVEGRIDLLEVLDVLSNWLLLVVNGIQASVYARGQAAKLLLCEPPFFTSRFRWIESRTSCNASVIRNPGGSSGPP